MSTNTFNPVSTYRIQFHKDFNFSDFEKIIPYLQNLGVRTIYASPVFEATPGSTHGYDGTDPNKINPEIGTEEQLLKISKKLKEKNISWLQDIVPNHLSYHENNKWLMDVLEKGQQSEHASVFDIIWNHKDYPNRLMVPFPGSDIEKELKEKYPGEKNYVLCSWQETDHRMNYRRFFLVNTLICTNVHDEEVFEKYHALIKKLVAQDVFQGLRVDHIDGLYDPTKYLKDLRELAGENAYLIIEKILEPGEDMPEYWPVQGNSGYDFLGIVNNLFTNKKSEFDLTVFYYDVAKDGVPVHQQIHEKKRMILSKYMGGELDNLVQLYRDVSGNNIADDELKQHIADYLVKCPVYRYYEDIPLMKIDEGKDPSSLRKFYQRCMQFTGPLMAKGVEDTLMYTYNRFIGHNEVGDSPEYFGYSINEFHQWMQKRNKLWKHGMNATSTHDTKRGEDVRARLNVITDLHTEWIALVKEWRQHHAEWKKNGAPDDNDEYFIYQTIAGSYPMFTGDGLNTEEKEIYAQRLKDYLQKALREAKIHTTWTEPNSEYEDAAIAFAHRLLEQGTPFYKSFMPYLKKITDYGIMNSFAQCILKFTCPGVPDVYQGTELWDMSLVDPDNRRPVDYALRQRMLQDGSSFPILWKSRWNGAIKLKLLHQLEKIRNRYMDVFAEGEYIPLETEGELKENVIAYLRKSRHVAVLVAIPLHLAAIHEYRHDSEEIPAIDWKDTKIILPDGLINKWEDLLDESEIKLEKEISVNSLFRKFPAAIIKGGAS